MSERVRDVVLKKRKKGVGRDLVSRDINICVCACHF